MPVMTDVEQKTREFLKLHWNGAMLGEVQLPGSWASYNLKGAVPNGDRQGCYALVRDGVVIYIGLAASRGGGLYKEHGIGARLSAHVLSWDRSIQVDVSGRVYSPRKKWAGITEICTYGFPPGYGYMAGSLEAYLISVLEPRENVIKTSSNSG